MHGIKKLSKAFSNTARYISHQINSGHKNKKTCFYPKCLRPFVRILCYFIAIYWSYSVNDGSNEIVLFAYRWLLSHINLHQKKYTNIYTKKSLLHDLVDNLIVVLRNLYQLFGHNAYRPKDYYVCSVLQLWF